MNLRPSAHPPSPPAWLDTRRRRERHCATWPVFVPSWVGKQSSRWRPKRTRRAAPAPRTRAQRSTGGQCHADARRRTRALARQLGDGELLARAALSYGSVLQYAVVDSALVGACCRRRSGLCRKGPVGRAPWSWLGSRRQSNRRPTPRTASSSLARGSPWRAPTVIRAAHHAPPPSLLHVAGTRLSRAAGDPDWACCGRRAHDRARPSSSVSPAGIRPRPRRWRFSAMHCCAHSATTRRC